MSFAHVELEVIRAAEKDGTIPNRGLMQHYDKVTTNFLRIRGAIEDRNIVSFASEIGEVAKQLVVLAALADLDLTECMQKAHERTR
jgi:NTP pyrophosphatase (non-canonical NTP hydrolase)